MVPDHGENWRATGIPNQIPGVNPGNREGHDFARTTTLKDKNFYPPSQTPQENSESENQDLTYGSWEQIAYTNYKKTWSLMPQEHLIPLDAFKGELDPRHVIRAPELCGILTERELAISLTPSAVALLEDIRKGVYTATEVTRAFCKTASIAHQMTNCVSEILYESALEHAQKLDEYFKSTGKAVGPLHGLPVSVKDIINVAGATSTCGYVAWVDNRAKEDALIIDIFRKAGAVFHVKTTNPQTLLSIETASRLYGRTTNPYNTDLSPGGSSGGEGALVAMKGSIFGIGTDIGGSIRAPAGFCGLYGLKPSLGRLPGEGLSWAYQAMESIKCVVGPMVRSVDDLELYCKVALDAEPWRVDSSVVPLPWKGVRPYPKVIYREGCVPEEIGKMSLRIGLLLTDGVIDPHPPITRCLQETVKALEAHEHQIIPWEPFNHREMAELLCLMFLQDGGDACRKELDRSGETSTTLIKWLFEEHEWKRLTIEETWELNVKRDKFREEYAKRFNEAGLDAILCPVAPTVATLHRTGKYFGYTSVWNMLDYCAVTFPAGHVSKIDCEAKLEVPEQRLVGANKVTSDLWFEKDENGKAKGPERYKYAPVGLQLVARRFEEERLLEMLKQVMYAREKGISRD